MEYRERVREREREREKMGREVLRESGVYSSLIVYIASQYS